jgi:CubicO group peptidase (beta-lactamase class C family)
VSTPAIGTAGGSSDRSADVGEQVEPTDLSDEGDFKRWFGETMADQLGRHHILGAAVVVRDDGVFLAKGHGCADLESHRPVVANETVFSIGSTGKLVTWTAVMQSVNDGRLELNQFVSLLVGLRPVHSGLAREQSVWLNGKSP